MLWFVMLVLFCLYNKASFLHNRGIVVSAPTVIYIHGTDYQKLLGLSMEFARWCVGMLCF